MGIKQTYTKVDHLIISELDWFEDVHVYGTLSLISESNRQAIVDWFRHPKDSQMQKTSGTRIDAFHVPSAKMNLTDNGSYLDGSNCIVIYPKLAVISRFLFHKASKSLREIGPFLTLPTTNASWSKRDGEWIGNTRWALP